MRRLALFASLLALVTLPPGCGGTDTTPATDTIASSDAIARADDPGPADDTAPGGPPTPPATVDGCNPVAAEWDCLFPYPSDVFRVPDGDSHRLVIPTAAHPVDYDGATVDILLEHPTDGAAILPQIVVMLPREVDPTASALPFHDDPYAVSTGPDSPTILLDTHTGERIAHFSEVDPKALAFGGTHQPLAIRPFAPLELGRRYIVAVRHLVGADATPLAPPATFAALRDDATDPWYELEIFPHLATAEIPRDDLTLAWDFTTASEAALTQDLRAVVDGVVAAVSNSGSTVTITSVQDHPDGHVARRIEGTFTVPLYVDSIDPGARLNRDADGQVTAPTIADAPFVALIPRSVADAPPDAPPARLVQFGHGFFGSVGEMGGYTADVADEKGFILVGMDWWGMSSPDRIGVIGALGEQPEQALRFVERMHQGMANAIALGIVATEQFAALPEFEIDGRSVLDPSRLYFWGISQGHILGGTYAGLSPRVDAVALISGGAGFGFVMTRSRSFGIFRLLIDSSFPDPVHQHRTLALMAPALERIDPALWSRYVQVPVLLQTGPGDTEVPSKTAHVHARALGAPALAPVVRDLPGISSLEGPIDGSAIVEYDLGHLPEETSAWGVPEAGTDVHESVRRLQAVRDQLDLFLRDNGRIENTCGGVCDPDALL